ncbi:Uncharacterised protein [Legionella maceachernii]|nr:Uncharacterised protein [Legionella maceachernii]
MVRKSNDLGLDKQDFLKESMPHEAPLHHAAYSYTRIKWREGC